MEGEGLMRVAEFLLGKGGKIYALYPKLEEQKKSMISRLKWDFEFC